MSITQQEFRSSKSNERSASLDILPFEIIELILNCDIITFTDICRLSSVSQIFNCIGKSNKLWQNKYVQKWPYEAPLYEPHHTDWKNEFRLRHLFGNTLSEKLSCMSVEFYHQDNVSQDSFSDFSDLCNGHPFTNHILINELDNIVHDSQSNQNLTHKYYAKKALRYMRHKVLEDVWQKYLSNGQSQLTLFKGACLVSQWCQPTAEIHCPSLVYRQMNNIIAAIFDRLKQSHPNHPAVQKGVPVLVDNNETILNKSLWTPYQCKVILLCINEVMYNSMAFCANTDLFHSADHTYIDKVLDSKIGVPIALGIIYHCVALQFGVYTLPVNFPGHFLLKWMEHPKLTAQESFTFIDVYDKGAFKTICDMEDFSPGYSNFATNWTDSVSPVKVFVRMCWNLVEIGRQLDGVGEGMLCLCDALELLYILSPDDMEHKLLLARVYMHLCINMTRVVDLLQEISEQDPVSTGIVGYMYRSAITTLETQKVRRQMQKLKIHPRDEAAADVLFAVGMIMRHKKYNYHCVIYGWDNLCTASKDWKRQMGVHKLPKKDEQPFYHVLVEDGSNRYAAQENLEIDERGDPVSHVEVGRYFESYHGSYYQPNSQKKLEYPDDISTREVLLNTTVTVG